MSNARSIVILALACIMLSLGCARGVKLDPATLNVAQQLSQPYRIHPGDTLDIKFKYHPADDQQGTVDTNGRLGLPITGQLQAGGMTIPELQEAIRERSSRYLRDPVVTVTVTESQSRAYVGGEVVDEGFVVLLRPTSVLEAVFERGGFTIGANLSEVVLLSRESGIPVARRLDLRAELEGDPSDLTLLAADEIVYVPQTGIAKANQFVDQWINGMIPDFVSRMVRMSPINP